MDEAEYLMNNYRDRRGRYITPFEICIILYMIRKQNSIIVLFIQNNSQFKVARLDFFGGIPPKFEH